MSTTIPCNVDTRPMADEIQTVSNHVRGTTAAVVTMQGAVIAAENNSAKKICSNVNRGFFTMMRSLISQKIANKQSRVEALIMKLGQQRRLLLGVKNNMEREYARIAERYLKIFTSINKELETRIRQIDMPVFDLVNKHMLTNTNRMYSLTGWATTSQAEGLTQSQRILVSNMKHNAEIALDQSTGFLSQIGEQRVLISKILISNPTGNEDKKCNLPVLVMESINNSNKISKVDIKVPSALRRQDATLIENYLQGDNSLTWKQKVHSEELEDEFEKNVSSSKASDRVKKLVREMFAASKFEIL